MRRLTWMIDHPHFWLVDWYGMRRRYNRQPMQRTEYYMPWGIVTVDELHKMGFAENYTVVLAYDEEPPCDYVFGD